MYDIIICVFACDTKEKYRNEILKINETWGSIIKEKYNSNWITRKNYNYLPGSENFI